MAKIVILDDVSEVCDIVRTRLSLDGHDVRTASAGEDAIDLAHLFKPELLITDWDLQSDYDGFEVAEAFIAANPAIKTIVISGHYSVRSEIQRRFLQGGTAAKLGLVASFVKPFSIERFAQAVNDNLISDKLLSASLVQ